MPQSLFIFSGHLKLHSISFSLKILKRINYLGDWGIQFAKLICGFQKYHQGDSEDIWKTETIQKLTQLYRKITEIEREPEILTEIDSINQRLENDGEFELDFHRRCVEASEIEYRNQYKLFNVEFDSWERESNQRKEWFNLCICHNQTIHS